MARDDETDIQTASVPPPPELRGASDQDALPLEALARAVLARELRPRAASVRRLAQGVLDLREEVKKARKKARKASAKKTGSGKAKSANKSKKLPKIPGQKKSR